MKRRPGGGFFALGTAVATWLTASGAAASPQGNASFTGGVAGTGDRIGRWSSTHLSLGVRGDVLLGRGRDADWGAGPYAEALTTRGFGDVQLGGGVALLVPVHPYLPIVLSGGGYGRHAEGVGWQPGLAGSLFWGSRGYNYHAPYSLAGGLLVQARAGVGSEREAAVVVGVQVDAAVVAMPFLLLVDVVRHGG